MSHSIGDQCDIVCHNCGAIFCTQETRICPVCGTVPWIYRGGVAKQDFNEWLERKLEKLKKEREEEERRGVRLP